MAAIFVQDAPRLGNEFLDDALLRSWLARMLPPEIERAVRADLARLGALAGGELHALQLADRLAEPRLVQWSAWGERLDAIEPTAVWRRAAPLAAELGLVALPYEGRFGEWGRGTQFALVHLFHPSTDVYSCPLAMSDGAARTLLEADNRALIERAVPRLTSRDPARFWTSGQWMTESSGGSDVGASLTEAQPDPQVGWRLHGRKWFTSAATSQMALTLARPAGNGPGGDGLAMFYVETRDAHGRLQNIRIERLKDKLGTRKVPTAELTLEGTPATLVGAITGGTRAIEPMLRITRTWNSVCAASFMRRGLALALDYARRRHAFGRPLAAQPLHAATLAQLAAEQAGAFLLAFALVELLGRAEAGAADEREQALLRLLLPIVKLTTGRMAVSFASEVLECFGGAGYVEDTGLPVLLRDSQVLPIWEGTTNVLALDALLRADLAAGLPALERASAACLAAARDARLREQAGEIRQALADAVLWLQRARDPQRRQAGARWFCLTLGRAFAGARLLEHAQWLLDRGDASLLAVARCFEPRIAQRPPQGDAP